MKGYATAEGTARYKDRFAGRLDRGHFRSKDGLWFSSIGIGSYLGEADDATDSRYEEALTEALLSGVNVVDSAINYRCQRSERSFGRALGKLVNEGKIARDEVILCTKGGFIPFDGSYPADPSSYLRRTYIESGILKREDVAQGCHAMTPAYLEDQLGKSLANLGVETVDIYYLHNPETQLAEVDRTQFHRRLRSAFDWCEGKVREGKIHMYGTATWNGYRAEREEEEYLSLEELASIAREVGGAENHLKAVQLPFNLAMTEALTFSNQSFGDRIVPLLSVASRLGIVAIGSASLLQSKLAKPIPGITDGVMGNLKKHSQRAIQFARSAPGMTTALVGMKSAEHVRENLEVAKVPPLPDGDFQQFLAK